MFDQVTRYFFNDGAEHRLGLVLCYCSVLDDCWMSAMGQVRGFDVNVDREIGRCPIADSERFQQ